MSLLGSLGLDEVSADPNAIPEGRYAGVVFSSDYVYKKQDNSVSHVITYQVVDGERKGAQRQEWYNLGDATAFADDGTVSAMNGTMTDDRKTWYKKRLVDLGVVEETISTTFHPRDLVGKMVTFGVKKNGNYININFVELREAAPNVPPTGENTGGLAGVLV